MGGGGGEPRQSPGRPPPSPQAMGPVVNSWTLSLTDPVTWLSPEPDAVPGASSIPEDWALSVKSHKIPKMC